MMRARYLHLLLLPHRAKAKKKEKEKGLGQFCQGWFRLAMGMMTTTQIWEKVSCPFQNKFDRGMPLSQILHGKARKKWFCFLGENFLTSRFRDISSSFVSSWERKPNSDFAKKKLPLHLPPWERARKNLHHSSSNFCLGWLWLRRPASSPRLMVNHACEKDRLGNDAASN